MSDGFKEALSADDVCPWCLGELDTGWECNKCGKDARRFVEAVAPCSHPIRKSKCIGTPNAQNLWKCGICGKEWLR